MVYEFKFPDIGEGITEGTVVKWVVKEGDKVKEDQTIAKIETDKALADVPSPKTGTIDKIMVKAGQKVRVGQTLVVIKEEGESAGAAAPVATEAPKKEIKPAEMAGKKDTGTGAVGELEEAKGKVNIFEAISKPAEKQVSAGIPPATAGREILTMPGVRQYAKQAGIDISKVPPTGKYGEITKKDVQQFAGTPSALPVVPTAGATTFKVQTPSGDIIEIVGNIQSVNITQSGQTAKSKIQSELQPESVQTEHPAEKEQEPAQQASPAEKPKGISIKKKYDFYGYVERKPLTPIRKTIAENMRKSIDTATHVTAMDEIDVTELWALREKEAKKAEKKKVKLTFLPYITRACIKAVREVPAMNSSLDLENNEIILKKYFNAGFAVATEAGLIVVVVKRAEQKTLWRIAKELQELAKKARERKISIADIKGSSFTITNWGSINGSYGTPIINPGESAILGVGRIRPVPAVVGKNKLGVRYILPVSLSFDHRITDGAEAAKFLQILKNELENPKNLEDNTFLKGLKKEEIFDIK